MSTVKLFLGYRSASLGVFSCQGGFPVGKKHILREIIEEECCGCLKGIYCGAYLNGAELPTYGMIAELSAESFKHIKALSMQIKKRFPESDFWATADFGWRRASCAVGVSLPPENESDKTAVALYCNLLYDFYKLHNVILRAFIVKEGKNLTLRAVGSRRDYDDLAYWLDCCHQVHQTAKRQFAVGQPVLSRVYAMGKF